MQKQYLIYSDESYIRGKFFSNFYGGALVEYSKLQYISDILNKRKKELNLGGEIKWSKMSENYLNKYIEMINLFFTFIKNNDIKIRIMFRQNAYVFNQLEKEKYDNEYQLLYYQFIKHSFGLDYCVESKKDIINLKLYFDQLPDTKEKNEEFKRHVLNLNNIFDKHIHINQEDIVEINSKDHVILQCMDIILGAINFKLNNLNLTKIPETNKRGKRTIAKEKLYKVILHNIREIYPNFNIGITTGTRGNIKNRWLDPYRHWKFITKGSTLNHTMTKKVKNLNQKK